MANRRSHSGSTVYSEKVADLILEAVASAHKLKDVCMDPGMPKRRTIMEWIAFPDENLRPGFVERYHHARKIGLLVMAEDLIDIADDGSRDNKIITTNRGREITVPDMENIQRARLRVATRQWMLAKLVPNVYGDAIKIEHSVDGELVDKLAAARGRLDLLNQRTTALIEGTVVAIHEENKGDNTGESGDT